MMLCASIVYYFLILAGSIAHAQAPQTNAPVFKYCPPGDLQQRPPRMRESGNRDRDVYFPILTYPVAFKHPDQAAVMNSQMYNPGGGCHAGPGCSWEDGVSHGSHCDRHNFQPPSRDTFCEKAGRGYTNRSCPDRKGHQGVDMRPPTVLRGDSRNQCKPNVWDAIAITSGEVREVRGAVVVIRHPQGATFTYRHLQPLSIRHLRSKTRVAAGDFIGKISRYNNSGTKQYTTPHLHIEAKIESSNGRTVVIPLYTSLIATYRRKVGLPDLIMNGKLGVDSSREIAGGC